MKWAGTMGACDAELRALGYPTILGETARHRLTCSVIHSGAPADNGGYAASPKSFSRHWNSRFQS